MKRNSIYLNIPDPCHESWDKMDATERGAFCHSCQKEVIDFSHMTDSQIIEYLSKHKTACGKLRDDQIQRPLVASQIKNGFLKWKVLLLGLLSAFSFRDVFATTSKVHSDQNRAPLKDAKDSIASLPKIALTREVNDTNYQCSEMISGKVVDEENKAIAYARVQLANMKGDAAAPVIITDVFGCFCITRDQVTDSSSTLRLCISHSDYQDTEVDINVGDALNYTILIKQLLIEKKCGVMDNFILGNMEIRTETHRTSIVLMPELPLKDFF